MGGCQNYEPLLGPLNNRCRIIRRTPKRTQNFDKHPCGNSGLLRGHRLVTFRVVRVGSWAGGGVPFQTADRTKEVKRQVEELIEEAEEEEEE